MIPGLSSSSGIASAMRTASQARATMDTMARQIATGQRVSSVKDDGAAWARTAALRAQQVEADTRRDFLAPALLQVIHNQNAHDGAVSATLSQMGDILRQAMGHAAGSQSRQRLAAEYAAILASHSTMTGATGMIETGAGSQADGNWGVRGPAADTEVGIFTVWTTLGSSPGANGWPTWDWAGNGMPYGTIDVLNATQAQLSAGLTTLESFQRVNITGAQMRNGRNEDRLDRVVRNAEATSQRLDGAIGALTDADLGKASAARAQAETRQQLAIATVRQAISTYAGFATGLLGNVQRTQRGVMA
jgi:flagellin-like hook-associated protein FlgL